MFYDIVFFLSPEAVAAGAKVSLVAGKYVITKAAATTIQAINGGRPPVDQAAQVVALQAQVAQLTTDLADCRAGGGPPPLPTITNARATPPGLPFGGGAITIDATVTDATSVTLGGVAVTLPISFVVGVSQTFVLVATNATGSSAPANIPVTVAAAPSVPTITGMAITPPNLPIGGGQVSVNASVVGADSMTLQIGSGPVVPVTTLPVTVTVT